MPLSPHTPPATPLTPQAANWLFLLYGMAIMYYALMAWLFLFRSHGRVKRMIAALMALVAAQCVKDLLFIDDFLATPGGTLSALLSGTDFVTVPFYGFVLAELCRPGWLRWRDLALAETPFALLIALYTVFRWQPLFTLLVALAAAFGCACFWWMFRELPRYHRRLKSEYSYEEDINLHWLRGVTALFFLILLLWVADCVCATPLTLAAYLALSLAGWMLVCHFIHKQQKALCAVQEGIPLPGRDAPGNAPEHFSANGTDNAAEEPAEEETTDETRAASEMDEKLRRLFVEEKAYLDPRLRLTDLARRIGTNRTYLSRYFNQHLAVTFYDYVNRHRLLHAERLLLDTDYTLDAVASLSGFNSLSTFRRTFSAAHGGRSPQTFRAEAARAGGTRQEH